MSEVLDRLLGSLSPWLGENGEVSDSFQSGSFSYPWPGEDSDTSGSRWDTSYDYGGVGVEELQDHYGDHSGYQTYRVLPY